MIGLAGLSWQVRIPAGHPELCWCRWLVFVTPTATPEGSGLTAYRRGWTGLLSEDFLSRHFKVSHTTISYFQILRMSCALNLILHLQASIPHNITSFVYTSLNFFYLIIVGTQISCRREIIHLEIIPAEKTHQYSKF